MFITLLINYNYSNYITFILWFKHGVNYKIEYFYYYFWTPQKCFKVEVYVLM